MKFIRPEVPKLVFVAVSVALSACGGINDTMKSTQDMSVTTTDMRNKMVDTNKKMDQTNGTMSGMSGKMDETNATMSGMSKKMDETNATMAGMSKKMDETNASMAVTNHAIHLQTMDLAFKNMHDELSTKYINATPPVPVHMMIPGKVFAESGIQEELAELTSGKILEINSANPSDRLKDPANGEFSQVVQDKVKEDKTVTFYVLAIIAGWTPQETVEKMVQEQVLNSGEFQDATYNFLALRHWCISKFLLGSQLLETTMTSVGQFEKALKYLGYLKYIERRSFVSEVGFQSDALTADKQVSLEKSTLNQKYASLRDKLSGQEKAENNQVAAIQKKHKADPKWDPKEADVVRRLTSKDPKIAARVAGIKTAIEKGASGQ